MGTDRVSWRYKSLFLSLIIRTIRRIGKADIFVKLGGHGSNRGNDKPSELFTKAMPIIAESQFSWSKNSISVSFDTGVRGDRRLVLIKIREINTPVTLATCDFAFFYQVSHKLDSRTELNVLTMRPETSANCGLGLKLDRGISPSWALARNSTISRKSDIPRHTLQTRLLPLKTAEVSKTKVCTVHDANSSEVCPDEALLGIVTNFSEFLSEALLGLFCKHFFRISLSLIRVQKVRKARKCGNPQKCGRLEALIH